MTKWTLILAFVAAVWVSSAVSAQEPGRSNVIIARGQQRAAIKSTNILYRPYRPLHFYGNTVRRRYYHGTALPRLRRR